jgi:hypothetical protein
MNVGGQRHVPAALPPEKTRNLLCRRLGGLTHLIPSITSASIGNVFHPEDRGSILPKAVKSNH